MAYNPTNHQSPPFSHHPPLPSHPHTDSFFTPPNNNHHGNIRDFDVFNGPLNIHIAAKVPRYPNILCVELYALLLAVEHTKLLTTNTFIFTDNLNNIYLLLNQLETHPPNTITLINLLIAHIIDIIK